MKLFLPFILAAAAFAQDQSKVEITITLANGTKLVESISGAPAAAGIDTLSQWMATQQTCPTPETCTPKYATAADLVKAMVLDTAERLAEQGYVSAALRADADEVKAKREALEAKRKAAFAAARAEK